MTFCLGMKVQDGLVGIADTRILAGNEIQYARKVSIFQGDEQAFFVMTSGLRSVRDKTLTYFEEMIPEKVSKERRLFKAVNVFSEALRRVSEEDRDSLHAGELQFNFHALIGGQFGDDPEHKLYLLYPEANWVEVGTLGTPYQIIGASRYGKPIIDRCLRYHDDMRFAFKVGTLAFDATRISAVDVDFPIHVVLCRKNSFEMVEHTYEKDDLLALSAWWNERMRSAVDELPAMWIEECFSKLNPVRERTSPARAPSPKSEAMTPG
jgi:putative proteasome-type protease